MMAGAERVGERRELPNLHDGKGTASAYGFFEGVIRPSMMFFNIMVKPGTYLGHHRHIGNDEILYILSGMCESFQDGLVSVVQAGVAILVKSGQSHAMRVIGDEDMEFLGFVAAPGEEIGTFENLPIPDAIADWV